MSTRIWQCGWYCQLNFMREQSYQVKDKMNPLLVRWLIEDQL